MSLVRWTSSLFGFKSQLKLPYVTSFILSAGTSSFLMNRIVLVGLTRPSFNPFASLPNSFADDLDHISLYFGCLMSWRYFKYVFVSSSYIVCARSVHRADDLR